VLRAALVLGAVLYLAGCAGVASAPQGQTNTAMTSNPPPPSPTVVNVTAGQTAAGVDVTVLAPVSTTPPNAEDLGVAQVVGPATASNSGAVIHQGSVGRIVLFGAGLSGDMTPTIRGPSDIIIEAIQSIVATDNTPGIAFIVTVDPNAALGCRTVVLTNPNGDVTTFAGGIEVVP